jgi:hypothetical protein
MGPTHARKEKEADKFEHPRMLVDIAAQALPPYNHKLEHDDS